MNKLEYQEEYIFDNKEVSTSLPGGESSDIDSLKYFFQKYLFSVVNDETRAEQYYYKIYGK